MKITSLVLALILAASAAYAQFNGCPPGFCPVQGGGGGGGGGTNFRVTNTGDFRVTSTGDSRIISP